MRGLLIANRGEIAIRIARAGAERDIAACMVFAEDDGAAPHVRAGRAAVALPGHGPSAYLDAAALVRAALNEGCDAVHPGYGFLSERSDFARACVGAGLIFVGPSPESLDLFGDKAAARAFARAHGAATIPGLDRAVSPEEMAAFQHDLGTDRSIVIKAIFGGGGRGMRIVRAPNEIEAAYATCAAEAKAAFGDGALYCELYVAGARHIEVQVAGDGANVVSLHDRECSIQRRHQKLIEFAPAFGVDATTRKAITEASLAMARAASLRGLCTFEYLVDPSDGAAYFIEANPRLQVEHTVTEEVTGLDLVQLQLRLADGETLAACGLRTPPKLNGRAAQLRIYAEAILADGMLAPTIGTIARYAPPTGPGVRVDAGVEAGMALNPRYDSLIAKLIVRTSSGAHEPLVRKARAALREFSIDGVVTNAVLLAAILETDDCKEARCTTDWLDAQVAVLSPTRAPPRKTVTELAPHGRIAIVAPLPGTIAAMDARAGDVVKRGAALFTIESMKMHHPVAAPASGPIERILVRDGQTVAAGETLALLAADGAEELDAADIEIDLEAPRADLAELAARLALLRDENRAEAVAKRAKLGQRTARANILDLFDAGSFHEYGALAVAAQRRRRDLEDLRVNTPADGMICGIGTVNGALVGAERARCVALAYDYTVLAGTQGFFNHKKADRVLELADHWRAPVIWYTEGGGGRPGDVDAAHITASSLDTTSFTTFARLSGLAPRIAVNCGRCFAGNAAFFGSADITIATRDSSIGMGGPAMIEGGGLGVYAPDDVGPSATLWANGVIDVLVADEKDATRAAKQLLSYFQGAVDAFDCTDQRILRHIVPQDRKRAYAVRDAIGALADKDSFIELRGGYGRGMVTGFLRLEGKPFGLIANDPFWLGGAIDAEAAEKAARFLQFSDAFDIPILSLCDTPGFMVGPESERAGAVRRCSRLFVTGASVTVPYITIVTRKGYGLGAQAMAGGDFSASSLIAAWPTGEFGPMGLEGAVRLGYRKELAEQPNEAARQALFEKLVARMYEGGKALSVAAAVEIDAVIDPAETRGWILAALRAFPGKREARRGKRPFVDVW